MQNPFTVESVFKLTNLANQNIKSQTEFKKMHTARTKDLIAIKATRQTQNIPELSQENIDSNLPSLRFQNDIDAKIKSNSENEKQSKMNLPVRSLRKVNMEFFRGKKVIFKHSNVRISFEIVGELSN